MATMTYGTAPPRIGTVKGAANAPQPRRIQPKKVKGLPRKQYTRGLLNQRVTGY
jgi:hypothetical protein